MYMQARYYDPVIGRFYSNDPVGTIGHMQRGNPIHGFNRYAYANNNPYKYTDPDGEFAFVILFAPEIIALGKAAFFVCSAALAGYAGSEAINAYNESAEPAAPDVESGKELDPADKGGELTKAGRAGQKPGSRPGSAFPTATGDANSKNNQGQGILEDIVNNPDSTSEGNQRGGTDVTAPDGKGARFDKDGKFTGFLEPKRNEQTN